MKIHKKSETESWWPVAAVYCLTVGLFTWSPIQEGYRLWGLSPWQGLETIPRVALLVSAFVAAAATAYVSLGSRSSSTHRRVHGENDKTPILWGTAIILALAALFFLLRAQTHFLGDGYQQLARLESNNPLLRRRDFGAELVHLWVYALAPNRGPETARFAYQLVSIVSGVFFATLAFLGARRIFDRKWEALLLFLGLISGGYSLLFFGYVENYSLFAVAVLAFCLLGVSIIKQRSSPFPILIPLATAIFFHILGVTLIPAAIYLLLWPPCTRPAWLQQLAVRRRLLVVGGVVVVLSVGVYFYVNSWFLRFAVLPVVRDSFTVSGYTLFSVDHFTDWLNLVVLLVPGILLMAPAIYIAFRRNYFLRTAIAFLFIQSVSAFAAAFIFDAKLGMARDWDLFAFCGIPLTFMGFLAMVGIGRESPRWRSAVSLSILLGSFALLPRVVIQTDPTMAIKLVRSYFDLDVERSRTGVAMLARFYHERGDTLHAEEIQRLRAQRYPHERLAVQAQALLAQGRAADAHVLASRLVSDRPHWPSGWLHLGRFHYIQGNYDSAQICFEIADGLNPQSYFIQLDLGRTYYMQGQYSQAVRYLTHAISTDPDKYLPYLYLSQALKRQGDSAGYIKNLRFAVSKEDARGWAFKELGDYYLSLSDHRGAAKAYATAMARGTDSSVIHEIVRSIPELERLLFPR